MKSQTWKARKLDYIKLMYKDNYDLYSTVDCHDDRRLYINMYDQLIEAISTMPEEPVPFVCVAMNNEINKSIEVMKKINLNFKGNETK